MLEKLSLIISEYTGKNVEVTEESNLIADIGISSFDLVQLVCKVEDEFDIEISDRAIKNFKTVGDVIRYIEEQ